MVPSETVLKTNKKSAIILICEPNKHCYRFCHGIPNGNLVMKHIDNLNKKLKGLISQIKKGGATILVSDAPS